MKIIYDPATDTLQIVFRDVLVDDYNEELPDIKVNYDLEDKIVSLEIKNASEIVDDPRVLQHEVLE
ncbi:MAG: DUF2283 domain-containing protein [Cyanobacteria bacterium RM1_2_2]|nr:DUF2283 domain-containing protein [Cyanobacteria bacterium RM1_2_2]